ncbi:hypothetical protein BGZ83_009916 [Gryganskiella cystojenkinii]|nr:hypothetical protein BGZ83_009916 [Gryganskiella cystojenkinii]
MSKDQKSWIRVFEIPELAEEIYPRLEPRSIHALRCVNKFFLNECHPYFAITLDIDNEARFPLLESMVITAIKNLKLYKHDSEEVRNRNNPLSKIRGLKVQSGHVLYPLLAKMVPGGSMAIILNNGRRRHLPGGRFRRDIANESTLFGLGHEGLHDPSDRTLTGLMNRESNHPLWGFHVDQAAGGRAWSFWDLFPLVGGGGAGESLLYRLETLTVNLGSHAPKSLDRFFSRLGRSSMTLTLKSLAVIESFSIPRSVAWDVLRSCLCSLKVLQDLKIENVQIHNQPVGSPSSQHYNPKANTGGPPHSFLQQLEHHKMQGVAGSVQSLTLYATIAPELHLAIMALFPNLRSLSMNSFNFLNHKGFEVFVQEAVDTNVNATSTSTSTARVTNNHSSPSKPTLPTPFPNLVSLDFPITTIDHWRQSQLLRNWVRRRQRPTFLTSMRHFELTSLNLTCVASFSTPRAQALFSLNGSNSSPRAGWALVQRLSQESVWVRGLEIESEKQDWICEVLLSTTFQALQELVIKIYAPPPSVSPVSVGTAIALPSSSMRPPNPQSRGLHYRVMDLFSFSSQPPWTQTLTRLGLRSPLQSVITPAGVTVTMTTVLRMLPSLVDFEIMDPIRDLAIFEGLGRCGVSPLTSPSIITASALADALAAAMAISTSASTSAPALTPDSSSDASPSYVPAEVLENAPDYQLKDYTRTERPSLKRLKLSQSHLCRSYSPDPWDDPLISWRARLLFKFRFLEDLILEAEIEPHQEYRRSDSSDW